MTETPLSSLITLGSNESTDLAENKEMLEEAIAFIVDIFGNYTKKSKYYQTPAFPKGAGPDFVNAAIAVKIPLSPEEILINLLRIEQKMGRKRTTRWAQRNIDLDLIAVGGCIKPDIETYTYWYDLPLEKQKSEAPVQLILPHPRLQDRAFVLGPLRDIAPDWMHPVLNLTIEDMWLALPKTERLEIKAI